MRIHSSWPLSVVSCTLFSLPSVAQLARVTPLPNGIDIRTATEREQITALRDDLLRVRIVPSGTLPEDASWAVLPSSRRERVEVANEESPEAVGFRTKLLRVRIDRTTLCLSIADLQGKLGIGTP